MPVSRTHELHDGELSVQRMRHTPAQLTHDLPSFISTRMPQQHAEFYAGLAYLPLAAMDGAGRPWASVVVTRSDVDSSVGIELSEPGRLNISAQVSLDDPLVRAITQTTSTDSSPLFAGVGVDFSNRRRNKLAGSIESAAVDASGKLSLTLASDEHLGNCPKYITVRSLSPFTRTPRVSLNRFNEITEPLSSQCKEVIDRASTAFLATMHTVDAESSDDSQADMGLNHRGGPPGFIRLYEETEKQRDAATAGSASKDTVSTYLVLPDYSGNRFYQSLGNIQSDALVGLVIPDFTTGDVLYVTGIAENLFNDDAERLMPRMTLVTRVRVTGAVFIEEALNLRLEGAEQLSPYNPTRRYLRHELTERYRLADSSLDTGTLDIRSVDAGSSRNAGRVRCV